MNGKNLPWDVDADMYELKEDWVTYNKYSHLYKDLWGIEVQREIVPNVNAREKYPKVTLGALWIGGTFEIDNKIYCKQGMSARSGPRYRVRVRARVNGDVAQMVRALA